jgi:hypothetical protein
MARSKQMRVEKSTMAELTLSQEDIQELLSVLHVALYDAETTKRISRDLEEIDAIEEHRELLRKWIRRLSQQLGSESEMGKE